MDMPPCYGRVVLADPGAAAVWLAASRYSLTMHVLSLQNPAAGHAGGRPCCSGARPAAGASPALGSGGGMAPAYRPRRSTLAVPGSSPQFLVNALELAADEVFLDLEEAVRPRENAP